jgi:hypothetical protein
VEIDRFDGIAKAVGRRTGRRIAVGAGALMVGFFGLRRDVPLVEAAGNASCRSLPPSEIISKNSCFDSACGGAGPGCVCVQTPGHIVRCAARFHHPADCPEMDECGDRRPCGPGKFCAKVSACCDDQPRRICLRPCPA